MKAQMVGVADFRVARWDGSSQGDALVTYALGSCIGLVVHDPVAMVGGLLHYMLPESTLDADKAGSNPAMFADTGIPLLFRSCYSLGAEKKRMAVFAAGGAQPLTGNNSFEIGKRNQLALKRILWKAGVILRGEALGGTQSRTVRLDLTSGRILMRTESAIETCVYDPAGRKVVQP